jgi:hypothetical protein
VPLGAVDVLARFLVGERMLYGRDLCRSGGTGKAEAAMLPGAGIGPKQCPEKCVTEKGEPTALSKIRHGGHGHISNHGVGIRSSSGLCD